MVAFRCDNTAAVTYVNSGGGRVPEGRAILRRMAIVMQRHHFAIRARHIAGKENVGPDDLSRLRQKASTQDYTFRPYEEFNRPAHEVDVACDRGGWNRQPGCQAHFHMGHSFLEYFKEAAGKRLWCNPPYALVDEFLEAIVQCYRIDRRTTATVVVPRWEHARFWRRYVRRGVFAIVREFPRGAQLFWRHESTRRANGDPAPIEAGPTQWPVVVATFPACEAELVRRRPELAGAGGRRQAGI